MEIDAPQLLGAARTAARLAGWAGIAFVGYATLSPINDRPRLASQGYEHIAAFFTIGALLAFAYPRRLPVVGAALVGLAGAFELAQFLTPDRHGRLVDFATKAASGLAAVLVFAALRTAVRRVRKP